MTKQAKIAIGIISAIAVVGTAGYFIWKYFTKEEDENEWEDEMTKEYSSGGSSGGKPVVVDAETRRKNNFNSVKNYFGKSASVYLDRVVVRKTASELAQIVGQPAEALGLGTNTDISVVYWKSGAFTVKVGNTIAALKGLYFKGGTIVKVTQGKGKFAAKVGRREEDKNRLVAISRAIFR